MINQLFLTALRCPRFHYQNCPSGPYKDRLKVTASSTQQLFSFPPVASRNRPFSPGEAIPELLPLLEYHLSISQPYAARHLKSANHLAPPPGTLRRLWRAFEGMACQRTTEHFAVIIACSQAGTAIFLTPPPPRSRHC